MRWFFSQGAPVGCGGNQAFAKHSLPDAVNHNPGYQRILRSGKPLRQGGAPTRRVGADLNSWQPQAVENGGNSGCDWLWFFATLGNCGIIYRCTNFAHCLCCRECGCFGFQLEAELFDFLSRFRIFHTRFQMVVLVLHLTVGDVVNLLIGGRQLFARRIEQLLQFGWKQRPGILKGDAAVGSF